MEKFAVDLDKVLDDFEYNEEQAIRHSQYIRQDLPAKKYQRPPFQRINLADADFSPSRQTSSPIVPHIAHPMPCGDQIENCFIDVAVEPVTYQNEETHSIPDLLGGEQRLDEPIVNSNLPDLTEIGERIVETTDSHSEHDSLVQVDNTAECQSHENIPSPVSEPADVLLSSLLSHVVLECNPPSQPPTEETISPEPIEEKQQEENHQLNETETETVNVEACGLIDKDIDLTDLPNNVEVNDIEEPTVPDNDLIQSDCREPIEDQKEQVTACTERVIGELEMVKPTELPPIKYLDDSDIPDEDLEKLLEQLDEEERQLNNIAEEKPPTSVEKENEVPKEEEVKSTISEEPPQRPSSLELKTETEVVGGEDLAEQHLREHRENERNERDESAGEDASPEPKHYQTQRVEAVNVPPGSAELPPPPTQEERRLGKVSPFWIPDADAINCMQCELKFTVIKRRHHCRACGRVLCGKCCGMKASIEYLNNQEHRVCERCFRTLTKVMMYEETDGDSETCVSPRRRPNPNNPMEYCSTVPPPLQASPSGSQPPPSVLVPVLKREGAAKNKEAPKKVMFSDGIRPGGDLTSLDEPPAPRVQRASSAPKRVGTPPGSVLPSPVRIVPPIDRATQSFIVENSLPPLCEVVRGQVSYKEPLPRETLMEKLRAVDEQPLLFAVNRHLIVSLKIVKIDCCMGQTCWVFSTRGMAAVGQDEMLVLLQFTSEEDEPVPCEVFVQLHSIYQSADKGNSVGELGYWSVKQSTFLDSRQHGGFLFVRPTFQCTQNLDKPAPPYLVAVLIHRLELPWARQFPLRLMLRLGAEFRYYPCSLVSVRHREPVYYEIGQTIMNLLADLRSYTYTLPAVRGLRVHMEAQQTSILIPRNRYDQVVRALNNSNDPVLALAGTFSPDADAHLVCMQSKGDEVTYSTQAINIHDKPRRVTGASFVVFNASLKAAAGVLGKSHIVEDGLMVEVSADTMTVLRTRLRASENWSVRCGANHDEVIQVTWCEDEKDFNLGVRSVIDGMALDGIPSIRVHNGTNYMCSSTFIRWTEVFIIKCEDGTTSAKIGYPIDVNRLAEDIAFATCSALIKSKLVDQLAAEGNRTIAMRATVTQDSVCYEAGSCGKKLAAVYMNSLDNELIPVLHKATANNSDACAILELVFHILEL